MSVTRGRDTAPERAVRSAAHRIGLRFYVDRPPLSGTRRRADLVFPRARVAVYVDGCFWHGCPEHATWPAHNADYWRAKIEHNRRRDADTNAQLEAAGWDVVRIWEHEDAEEAARRVAAVVRARQADLSAG
jgi:DNA mismatch endonuclease, patch repair protein